MMKEVQELQAFCQSVKTFEEAMECQRRSQEFQKKWGAHTSLQTQSLSTELYLEMVKEALELQQICQNAKTPE